MNRWPLNKAYFWEQAPFFRVGLAFAAGILVYDKGWLPDMGGTACAVVAVSLLLLYVVVALSKRKVVAQWAFALGMCALFFCGYGVSRFSDVRQNAQWMGHDMNSHAAYLAIVDDTPAEREHTWKIPVHMVSAIENGHTNRATGNAFVYVSKEGAPMNLHKGDSVLVPGRWELIKNTGNPFEFDYATYCQRNNILYRQFCRAGEVRLYGQAEAKELSFTDRAHNWCMLQLATYLPDAKTQGLIQAMLLGDEVNLDEELRQSYTDTGIVHIIAISGGNVMIFFGLISVLLWWLKDKKHFWVKYLVALPLVWFYVLMAGAGPSAVRAAIMFSLLAGAVIFQKNNNSLNTLFGTAFVLLCGQPMWLFSIGFQLSFAAVLSIIIFYSPLYKLLSPPNKILRAVWKTIAASISAELLVAPLVIYYFHSFPLLFIVANVVAFVFMEVVLWLGMGIIALAWLPAVAKAVGWVTIWWATYFDRIVVWLQQFNPPSFRRLVLSGFELVVVYILIAGIAAFLMKKQKAGLYAGLVACCVLVASLCTDQWAALHQQRLVVYNIAKANRIELITGKTCHILNCDTVNQKKVRYATDPAHIGWRVNKYDSSTTAGIVHVAGKTAVVLNDTMSSRAATHVDYVVVNYKGDIDVAGLQRIYSPSVIVMGNNYSDKEQVAFEAVCRAAHVGCYVVGRMGAFVVE